MLISVKINNHEETALGQFTSEENEIVIRAC